MTPSRTPPPAIQPTGVQTGGRWADGQCPSRGRRPGPIQDQTDASEKLPSVAGEAGWAHSLPAPRPSLEEATVLRTGRQASSSSYGR